MSQYFFGQTILAYVRDGKGHTKEHPCLIIGSDEDCATGGPLQTIVISSNIRHPIPHFHLWVHDSNKVDRTTGLWRPCLAKCNWIQDVDRRRVLGRLGAMPDDPLDRIIDKFQELLGDASFDGWIDHDD